MDLAPNIAHPQGGYEDLVRSVSMSSVPGAVAAGAGWVRPMGVTGGVWEAGLAKAGGG